MSSRYAELAEEVLPYTVGDGAPEYRTNPTTKVKYSHQELNNLAKATSTSYNLPLDFSEKHLYNAVG